MKVLVHDQLIEYKDEGSGKVVLLLHGWGASLSSFDHLAAYLSKNYRVIRLDFPGFGSSPKPSAEWGVGEYAELTDAFLRKMKILDLYTAIGHSFGGRVIIKGIDTGNLSPQKVVLMGAAGIKASKTLKKSSLKVIAKVGKVVTSAPGLRNLRTSLRRSLYNAAGNTDYIDAGNMQTIFLKTVNEDLLHAVSSITQPTLLVWGENDFETPVSDGVLMHERIKKSELVIVPNAGHFVYLDETSLVEQKIGSFL